MLSFIRSSYPTKPGAYIMRNKKGEVIYVGKATNIRSRLSSYFAKSNSQKTRALISKTASIDFVVAKDETEALILEANLIKSYLPHYNILLKDAKHFSYLAITDEEFPRLITARKNSAGKFRVSAKRFFGPFIEAQKRAVSAAYLRKLFRLRVCKSLPKKECLQYHIGNCSAPCIGKTSKEEYVQNVKSLIEVLEGKREAKKIIAELKERMSKASEKEDFELAMRIRNQIESLEIFFERQSAETRSETEEDYLFFQKIKNTLFVQELQVRRGIISAGKKHLAKINSQEEPEVAFVLQHYAYSEPPQKVYANLSLPQRRKLNLAFGRECFAKPGAKKAKILKIASDSLIPKDADAAVLELKDALKLPKAPMEIETFDISTLFGKNTVGAMSSFSNAEPKKSGYRKFLIRSKQTQDDYAAIYEIVSRRYSSLLKRDLKLPDLILIDGGPGQLRSAERALEYAGAEIPICSLAKKEEVVYLPGKKRPIKLPARSMALRLLQKCRDEAHRFAVSYHRKRREMRERAGN
ncbi:excinuclease ABC subunit C [Candidatus Micrarchaeota archaeon]|nr:excinuclease ABC subunit C [Candidatus Micrarchaeota archaeon]